MKLTMNKMILIFCLLGISLTYSTSYANEMNDLSKPDPKSRAAMRKEEMFKRARSGRQWPVDEKQVARMRQAVKASSKDFTFKGKVVDFQGDPVDDALVVVSVRSFDPDSEFFFSSTKHKIPTDKDGGFVFSGNGMSLSIRDIIKKDYEFDFENIDYSYFEFDYSMKTGKAGNNVPFDSNSEVPAIMKIRKRGKVDYLFKKSFNWPFKITKNESFQPLLLGQWNNSYGKELNLTPRKNKDNKPLDLSCEFNDDNSKFKLTFDTDGNQSEICLLDNLLYEAPLDGYRQTCVFQGDITSMEDKSGQGIYDKDLFLYVKGPEEKYYSRVDLSIRYFRRRGSVSVSGEIYTNPEGRRYLEYDKKFNSNEKVLRNIIRGERSQALREINRKYWVVKKECQKQGIKFDKKKFEMENKFDEKEFKEKIKVKYKDRDWRKVNE